MFKTNWLGAFICLPIAAAAYGERDAAACGGCFTLAPPPEAPPESVDSVITGERMIFSISKDQTTLYDEITYSGSPASFAWVLPIKGEVVVGLSADILFGTLDQLTASTVVPPPTGCPPPPANCAVASTGGCGFSLGGSSSNSTSGFAAEDASTQADGGVTVLTQQQVGPYETVQLKSNDGSALTSWLDKNGYRVPASDAAVIAHYVSEGMDFLALKLVPGEGVSAMQPIRVTTKGAYPVLPLRMVAVGTGATTGITLWVVADGRWEPQDFPFFTIKSSELSWDWSTSSSNYETLRLSKESALGGRGWQIESSLDLSQYLITNTLLGAIQRNFSGAGGYVDPTPIPSPGSGEDAGGADGGNDSGEATDSSDVESGTHADAASPAEAGHGDAGSTDAAIADAGAGEASAPDAGEQDAWIFPPTAQTLAREDLAVLFAGISGSNVRITRLRSDIAHSALSNDLVIQAASDQSELSNTYNATQQIGQPLCPIYDGNCNQTAEVPRDQALADENGQSSTSEGGCGCKTTSGQVGWRTTLGIIAAAASLGVVRSRRRRRTTPSRRHGADRPH
jgi:uncharacterized protein DUF2330